MKKFLRTVFLTCVFSLLMSINSFASHSVTNNSIYVSSQTCPQAVVDYVNDNIASALLALPKTISLLVMFT